ncbi:MAG: SCP2 sterol-binding domain-containing protein [Clostridia bacterium]|nr:SCP2 sterol-binding domain-containing protein [Clostridia bacterium]MBQ9507717.1 SCP2 sterol-binding domain-containing protein [Clostridia bacterium]MBR5424005.1 SCP2 sterol-binding domain-containing protein [Clostridia bacterium]
MTFTEKYEQLKETYAAHADFSRVKEDLAAEITLTDPDCGGTFYVTCKKGKHEIAPYNYYDSTVRISVSSALLEAMLQGKKDPVSEFLLGNVDAEGEASHALALIDALRVKKRTRREHCPPAEDRAPKTERRAKTE